MDNYLTDNKQIVKEFSEFFESVFSSREAKTQSNFN